MANVKATDLIDFTRASKGHALAKISYGEELVENGTFDSTTTGWLPANSTLASVSEELVVTNSVVSQYGYCYQGVPTTVGKLYLFTIDITATSSNAIIRIGDDAAGNLNKKEDVNRSGPDSIRSLFVATASTTYIRLGNYVNTLNATSNFDNVSLKEVLFNQPDGSLQLFEHPDNIPRIEYDADGNLLGLLVEESRTNYIPQSNSFSSDLGDTVTPNYALSPDGTQNAWLFTSEGDAAARVKRLASAVNGGGDNTVSWFVKNVDADYVQIVNGGNANLYCNFDLTNGTVGIQGLGSTGGIEDYGNGWYRIFTTWDGATYSVNTNNYLYIQNSANANYGAAGASGLNVSVLIYGCQWEYASFPTSYIKSNSGSTTTRSADVASIPVADFGWNNGAGTVVAEVDTADASNFGILWSANADSFQNRTLAYINNDLIYMYNRKNNGTEVNDPYANAPLDNTPLKHGYAFTDGDFNHTLNGGAVETVASNEMPVGINSFDIGNRLYTSGGHINGHIKSIQYYPRRLTDAQLQALTEPRSTPTLSLTFDGLESSYTENYIHG